MERKASVKALRYGQLGFITEQRKPEAWSRSRDGREGQRAEQNNRKGLAGKNTEASPKVFRESDDMIQFLLSEEVWGREGPGGSRGLGFVGAVVTMVGPSCTWDIFVNLFPHSLVCQ